VKNKDNTHNVERQNGRYTVFVDVETEAVGQKRKNKGLNK